MDMVKLLSQPIFFKPNRVYRVYKGGKGIAQLCELPPEEDDFFPEEWIASSVKAINPRYFGERDGVAVIEGTDVFFDDALRDYPALLTGKRKYDCLIKYLDSAIRLPMQVHPTRDFAKAHFGSPYGKTEAWLVLATRPNAKIFFGFNRPVNKEELSRLEERSETERDIMSTILAGVDAKVGDVYIINAGLIHAIGAGCTILEVQEPTDFTIQPERWCGDYHISEQEEYIGLDKSTALDCFDYSLVGEKALKGALLTPQVVRDEGGVKVEKLIGYEDTPCFAENRITLTAGAQYRPSFGPSVWIVLEGAGVIEGEDYRRDLKKGDYFYLPYVAEGKYAIGTEHKIVLAECLPSKENVDL
jgi:mannose-6-phosphate isomerase